MLRPPPTPPLFPYTTLFRSLSAPSSRTAISTVPEVGSNPAISADTFLARRIMRIPCSQSPRSEEHTSELQSHSDLVCRLLLEKKKQKKQHNIFNSIIMILV